MTMNTNKHRVALVVIVDAEGVDARDAQHVAERAVGHVLDGADLTAAELVAVAEVNVALHMGTLRVTTTDTPT